MGDELLLGGTRAYPNRLLESGDKFHFSELEPALTHLLTPGAHARSRAVSG
jgi:NAD dependent epimerase/dehydratase family enzyme